MASERYTELKSLSVEELNEELVKTSEEYKKMKFDHSIKGIENPLQLRSTRRSIAQINTEIRRREIESMSAEELASRSKKRSRRRNNNK